MKDGRLLNSSLFSIRAFLMTVEFGNVTRASEALEISQPSLSRILSDLERELGTTLFSRSPRGVRLTDSGIQFQIGATNILRQVDGLVSDVRSHELSPGGRVVVGLPVVMTEFVTRPLATWFSQAFPRAQISIHEGISDELEFEASLGRLDVALLISGDVRSGALETYPVANEQIFLHGPRDGARTNSKTVTWKTLSEIPLILPRRSNVLRRKIEDASRRYKTFSLNVIAEINTPSTILSLVENGAGYTLLPGCASYFQRRRGAISASPVQGFKIVWTIVRHRNAPQPVLVSAAEKKLRTLIRSQSSLGLWHPV
jgi:LysR family nitrogen assimilation transcriptional regulator